MVLVMVGNKTSAYPHWPRFWLLKIPQAFIKDKHSKVMWGWSALIKHLQLQFICSLWLSCTGTGDRSYSPITGGQGSSGDSLLGKPDDLSSDPRKPHEKLDKVANTCYSGVPTETWEEGTGNHLNLKLMVQLSWRAQYNVRNKWDSASTRYRARANSW